MKRIYAAVEQGGSIVVPQPVRDVEAEMTAFYAAVNTAYPNKLKWIHHNYSPEDGLFYVTVEGGTSETSTKTLVVGDGTGILATLNYSFYGWHKTQKTHFAIDGLFGLAGHKSSSSQDFYFSFFQYNASTHTITNVVHSVGIGPYLGGGRACFRHNGHRYIQYFTNMGYNAFVCYDLDAHEFHHNSAGRSVSCCALMNESVSRIHYIVWSWDNNSYPLRIASMSSATGSLDLSADSNIISAYYGKQQLVGFMCPDSGEQFATWVYENNTNQLYKVTWNGTTQVSCALWQKKISDIHYLYNFIVLSNGVEFYCSKTSWNIVKINPADANLLL